MKSEDFQLILVDPNEELSVAFSEYFSEFKNVSVELGYFQHLSEYDCMVSAANSFGLMDGGVDAAITAEFGTQLMERVQKQIIANFRGEQPVGTSFIIETGDSNHPFLAHTPTMRVPMPIATTDDVYKAMFAMLLAVWRHNEHSESKIRIVACPGLGTATGRVPPNSAARQMSLAYEHFLHPPTSIDWDYATSRQKAIGLGGDIGFYGGG